jgi:predicted nucleic acid-binding protein
LTATTPTRVTDRVFIDSNVLLYLLSTDAAKAERAEALLTTSAIISVQVLNEISNVARRKLKLPWVELREFLGLVRSLCRVDAVTVEVHERALDLAERYGFSVYDSLIVAAALKSGAVHLYTEDMQAGLRVDGRLTLRNPFAIP